jgi:peptidoglycan/LPS O-acetylase OafA/YrhL
MKTNTIDYRADIDGLRAIAVSLAVIFHAYRRPFDLLSRLIVSGGLQARKNGGPARFFVDRHGDWCQEWRKS